MHCITVSTIVLVCILYIFLGQDGFFDIIAVFISFHFTVT